MAIAIMWTALASIAVFFAVRLTLALLSAGGPGEERSLDGVLSPSESSVVVLDHRPDAVPALSRLLSRTATQRQIQLSIIRAGMMLRPSELISLSVSLALLGLMLGWALKGPILGVLVCLVFGGAPWIYV